MAKTTPPAMLPTRTPTGSLLDGPPDASGAAVAGCALMIVVVTCTATELLCDATVWERLADAFETARTGMSIT
jgi:hypothetical protein